MHAAAAPDVRRTIATHIATHTGMAQAAGGTLRAASAVGNSPAPLVSALQPCMSDLSISPAMVTASDGCAVRAPA